MESNNKERINETIIKGSSIDKIDKHLYTVCKSACKIIVSNTISSGFLIKLFRGNNPFYCLMTCEHFIEKEAIKSKEKIEIYYDNEQKQKEIELNENKRYIQNYLYLNIDVIIIEIIKEDNINKKYFLLPNLEYINGYDFFKNKGIYIIQYPNGEDLSHSKGIIKSINNYEFSHLASTKQGSSGSPIFIENTTKVIGIHKQSKKDKSENYGNFIGPIIESLKKNLKYDKKQYDKDIYFGEFKNEKREGYGKYILENGECYIGQWSNDKKHGKGILYNTNGNIKYDGDFVNDKIEGYGKYTYENGNYYIGQFLNDKRHGKGIEYYKNGKIKYEGDFVNDKFEGNGLYIYENGNYYIGQFFNDKRHGKGLLFYKNGEIKYDGDFVNDNCKGYEKDNYNSADDVIFNDNKIINQKSSEDHQTEEFEIYPLPEIDDFNISKYLNSKSIASNLNNNTYAVYKNIDSTPLSISTNSIIDWSNEEYLDMLNHTSRSSSLSNSNNIDILNTSDEVIFIGNKNKTINNLRMHLCSFNNNQKFNLKFINFNFISNGDTAIALYQDKGVDLEITFEGECSIKAKCHSGNIIGTRDKMINKLTILGLGNIIIIAGNGEEKINSTLNGGDGGIGIYAKNVTINLDENSTLTIYGGDGANGINGSNGPIGSPNYKGWDDRNAIVGGSNGGNGGNGQDGGAGGKGGYGIYAQIVNIKAGKVTIYGGNSGDGGMGGAGGKGGKGQETGGWGATSGNGGKGGNGGNGGNSYKGASGIYALSIEGNFDKISGQNGQVGIGGAKGLGGERGYHSSHVSGQFLTWGNDGHNGEDGNPGNNGKLLNLED